MAIVWTPKIDLRSVVPGPKGEKGDPGSNAIENAAAVSAYVGSDGNELRSTLFKNGLTGWLHVEGWGAGPNKSKAVNTAALLAVLAIAQPGDTIYFGRTGSGAGYEIAGDAVQVPPSKPNIRLLAAPRDAYATSLRCFDAGTTMLKVKATGFVLENIGLWGDADVAGSSGGSNGAGATVTGLELFGDTDGNVDAAIRGATFQYLSTPMILHGRNTEISENTLFSNCLSGVRHVGKDASYHTGPGADQNRGNVIRHSRFHNIGTSSATAAIEFTAASKLLHAMIDGNHFDSGGLGKHIVITGTSADPAKGVTIVGNKHTEASADAVTLTYCYYPRVSDFEILGNTVSGVYGSGVVLNNCLHAEVTDFTIVQVGKDAVRGTGNNGVEVSSGRIIQVGTDPATVGNALSFDSSNVDVVIDDVTGSGGDGWFFTGSPTGQLTRMTDCGHTGFTLGGINSTTVVNRSARGLNSYVEGRLGRIEDIGQQSYDFTAGVAKTVATINTGGSFSTFALEVEFTANNGSNQVTYLFARRVVNPANGVPVIVAVVPDVATLATIAITPAGTTGVAIAITTTNTVFGGVRIRTSAGGATNGTNKRGAEITMA